MKEQEENIRKAMSRRDMLRTGAFTVGAAALGATASCAGPQPQAEQKPAGAAAGQKAAGNPEAVKNMHLSLAAYSVRQQLGDGRMTLFDFIDWCSELGLPGTELTSYYFREGFDNKYLKDLKLRAFQQGCTVSGTAIANDFTLPPGKERDENLEHLRKWIDYAAEFGAPHIRIFSGHKPDGVDMKTAVGWAAENIRTSLEYAAEKGVVLGLENHGGITALVEDHMAICDAVGDHPWFGVNLDTGNYRTNPYESLAVAAPRAVNVQVKVAVTGPNGEKEPADLKRIRDILVDAGYKGWVALEYEEEEDPMVAIPRYVKQMKELFE